MSTPPNQQTDPEQLRREIEEIRRELGETVAQLAHKADVKAQAREKVQKANVQGAKDNALRHTPDSARGGAQQVAASARQHPAPLALGGALLVGFLIGRRIGRRG
jgi:ElaB/YqjD/DUF883 family membrane-anchored ribosome-binding protein